MLIKSFEGFRPRAIQRENGGWVIGYGHTLSAREGATVSEGDAELLLRYDLLPVEKTVNDTVPGHLNQHQFDALVSFALSVGIDRFAGSDVRQRLNAGAPGEAADAMMGWPEPALPDAALRRRAAERALFVANPDAPVALSDLLSAPLPPPAVPIPDTPVETEAVADPAEPAATPATVPPLDSRSAAVAALLGETADRLVQPDAPTAPVPTEETTEALAQPDLVSAEPRSDDVIVPFGNLGGYKPSTETPSPEPVEPVETSVEVAIQDAPALDVPAPDAPAQDTPAQDAPAPDAPAPNAGPKPSAEMVAFAAARYAPYSSVMVGPLAYLKPSNASKAPAAATDETLPVETPPAPIQAETVEPETTQPEAVQPEPAQTETVQPEAVEPPPFPWPAADPVPAAELVLTPLDDAPEPAIVRPLWTPEQRDAPDGSENNLFGEDLTLTLGGAPVMRHEVETQAPARFDWKETGPFIFMGGVGLVSFGASMAAFRRAAEQSGGGDLTIIGWVLALIGLGCVGVSSVNLYRKFGLPGAD